MGRRGPGARGPGARGGGGPGSRWSGARVGGGLDQGSLGLGAGAERSCIKVVRGEGRRWPGSRCGERGAERSWMKVARSGERRGTGAQVRPWPCLLPPPANRCPTWEAERFLGGNSASFSPGPCPGLHSSLLLPGEVSRMSPDLFARSGPRTNRLPPPRSTPAPDRRKLPRLASCAPTHASLPGRAYPGKVLGN